MRAGLKIAAVVGFVAVAAGAGYLLGTRGDDGDAPGADPDAAATIELPPPDPETSPPGSDALAGDAALVSTFRQLSSPLLEIRGGTSDTDRGTLCRGVAEDLNGTVDPAQLLDASFAITDPVLSELAVSDRAARSDLILACVEGDREGTDAALAQVVAIDVLFERRLEEL